MVGVAKITNCTPSTATTDLVLDLLHGVCEEDGCVGVGGTHLGLGALQGREEGGVEQSWLVEAKTGGHIPSHAEIRVLQVRETSGAIHCSPYLGAEEMPAAEWSAAAGCNSGLAWPPLSTILQLRVVKGL